MQNTTPDTIPQAVTIPDPRYLKAIDGHLERLAAVRGNFETWVAVRDVLNWLYDVEHIARHAHGAKPWFAIRSATPEGQTFGALIWFRGLRVHELADAKSVVLVSTAAVIKARQRHQSGGEKASLAEIVRDTPNYRGVRVAVPGIWPDRDTLPTSEKKPNPLHGFYDQHVAGSRLAGPLRVAREFVASL